MKRNVGLGAIFAVAFILNACTAAPASSADTAPAASTAAANTVQPEGMYKIQDSPDYTFLKLQNGLYGVWHAGDECNKDFAKAPSSCLDTGTYTFNADLSEITFVDDATGKSTTTPFSVSATSGGGSIKTQHTAVKPDNGDGNSDDANNSDNDSNNSDDQKPYATAFNLRKCVQALTMACNLLIQDPNGTGSEPLPEPKIELPAPGKRTAQG